MLTAMQRSRFAEVAENMLLKYDQADLFFVTPSYKEGKAFQPRTVWGRMRMTTKRRGAQRVVLSCTYISHITALAAVHSCWSMADVPPRLRASENSATGSTGCSLVYVQDDAIFCVAGAVCGERTHGQVCPARGDESVSGCSSHMKSYDPVTKRCVAPIDSMCEKLVTGDWGCVFPETKTAIPPSSSRSSSSSSHTKAVFDSTPTTYRLEHPHSELSLVGWNSIIVVAILMSMVVVGIAIMCKRRRDGLTPRRTIQRSPGAISAMEILTPL